MKAISIARVAALLSEVNRQQPATNAVDFKTPSVCACLSNKYQPKLSRSENPRTLLLIFKFALETFDCLVEQPSRDSESGVIGSDDQQELKLALKVELCCLINEFQ